MPAKPSLFTLFQRGRYFHPAQRDDDDSEEARRARAEAERFVAAAVGFCMTHHASFRKAFLRDVCGIDEAKGARCTIEVEPESWADLLIRVGKRGVCVVEFKVGAKLQPRQDPTLPEFWAEGDGYGDKFHRAFPDANKRYVVLGCREWLGIADKRERWTFQDVSWGSVRDAICGLKRRGPLIDDLVHCLVKLGIWEFSSNMTKDIYITPSGACSASLYSQLLSDVINCPHLKLSTGVTAARWDAAWENRDCWRFGVELWPQADAAIGAMMRPRHSGPMVWLGYESVRRLKEARRVVRFYCDEPPTAKSIAAYFKPKSSSKDRLIQDADNPCEFTKILHTEYGYRDQDLFIGILSSLRGMAMHRAEIEKANAEDDDYLITKRRRRPKPRFGRQ